MEVRPTRRRAPGGGAWTFMARKGLAFSGTRAGDSAIFNLGRDGSSTNLQQVSSSRVDRLLLQRMRKSQSTTVLYGNEQSAGPEVAGTVSEDSVHTEGLYPPMVDSGEQEARLIVVANRLPVSAFKGKDGRVAAADKCRGPGECADGGGQQQQHLDRMAWGGY